MIGETLAHYTILEKLGEGGMGEVYLAEDAELKRKVAIKVLPAGTAADADRLARFRREAEAVAALNHPNIVTIYSVEQADDKHFLTMEWVEGQTLGQLMSRGALPLEKIFGLGIPIADALSAAHEKGITHRDLKPPNIMISDEGRVKILDFGLAKLQQETAADSLPEQPTQGLTQEGLAVGTVPYMSPEQVRGEQVDHRTDIFSLGILLYEMVSGQRPFSGKSSADVVSSVLRDRPPTVTELNASLPHHLGRVIHRCLDKDPEKRFQTAKDVRNELEGLKGEVESGVARVSSGTMPAVTVEKQRANWLWPAATAAAVVALLAVVWSLRGGEETEPTGTKVTDIASQVGDAAVAQADREMVVVLPFENLGEADDVFFAVGVSEEISGRLASVSGLGVISRKSAQRYAQTDKTIQKIGEELGVDYVLEGTVRWARQAEGPSRVRIAPQLIRVADDTQIWTEIYDREIDDIFRVQSEIAGQVIDALGVTVLGTEAEALETRPTENLEAYQAFLRARDLWRRVGTLWEFKQVEKDYQRAVELDPSFVEAWSYLSWYHSLAYHGPFRTEARLAQAKEALDKASALGTDLPVVRLARGFYHYYGFRNYDRALEEFEAAAESLPNDSEVIQAIALIYRRQGKLEQCVAELKRAAEVDPQAANLFDALASTYRALRLTDETLAAQDHTIALEPATDAYYWAKANNLLQLTGDLKGAWRVVEQVPGNDPISMAFGPLDLLFAERDFDGVVERLEPFEIEVPFIMGWRAVMIATAKSLRDGAGASREELEAARETIEELLETSSDPNFHEWLAHLHALLGNENAALREAKQAVDLTAKDAFEGPEAVESLAGTYALLGRNDEALELLKQLMASNYADALTVHQLELEPVWDPLRDDPRFQALIEKHS